MWSGVIILGAGAGPGGSPPRGVTGKPYLIAIGQNDHGYASAKSAAEQYKKYGADVTFQTFAGKGHEVDTNDPVLKQWLTRHGPAAQAVELLAAGRAAEKNHKLGEALVRYSAAAKITAAADESSSADKAAKSIAQRADAALAQAEKHLAARQYPLAIKQLVDVKKVYAGSDFATRAEERLRKISFDPALRRQVAQAEADADPAVVRAQALAAEKAHEFTRAIGLYEKYVKSFPAAIDIDQIKSRLEALKSNKAIQTQEQTKKVDSDCRSWLSIADNYIRTGMPDKGVPYLHRIIDTYGGTSWAQEARSRLQQIESSGK